VISRGMGKCLNKMIEQGAHVAIEADVRFHPEVPLLPFRGLMRPTGLHRRLPLASSLSCLANACIGSVFY
jgi:hypothetical protein